MRHPPPGEQAPQTRTDAAPHLMRAERLTRNDRAKPLFMGHVGRKAERDLENAAGNLDTLDDSGRFPSSRRKYRRLLHLVQSTVSDAIHSGKA